jgi:transcriptional regulator with XRE-family HTH domain
VAGVAEGQLQRIVGENLARVRHSRNLSQEELAEELDFHRTYLGAVERGERNLTLRSVERLARNLGIEPLDLLKPQSGRRVGKA